MTMPISTGSSYSSRSSIVGCVASMSSIVAKRWTRIASRSPYGIGWRTSATFEARVEQDLADLSAGLALAAAGARRADGDDRLRLSSIVASGPEQPEVGAGGEHERRLVHDRLVGEIAVGEDDLVDVVLVDELVSSSSGRIGIPCG